LKKAQVSIEKTIKKQQDKEKEKEEKETGAKLRPDTPTYEFEKFEKGDILVTEMTTPDWEPIMKISSGIITNKGGRTCHAAIVARELALNAIVGTGNGTEILNSVNEVTISCAEGEQGNVYHGILDYEIEKIKTK
jgi:pyruvate,water dikinase